MKTDNEDINHFLVASTPNENRMYTRILANQRRDPGRRRDLSL